MESDLLSTPHFISQVQVSFPLFCATLQEEPTILHVKSFLHFMDSPLHSYKVCQFYPRLRSACAESLLVSWCFEPSQPQRITSGLNTNFNLSPSHSFHKSLDHKSFLLKPQLKFYPQFRNAKPEKNDNTCFGSYLYSASTHHGNLHPAG